MPSDTKVDVIIEAMRQRILEGKYGTEGRLPSLRMLAEDFGTTHETMNKVIQWLQGEGILLSRGRAGIFVLTSSPSTIHGITPRFDLFLKQQGLKPIETNIKDPSIVPAPEEIAKIFKLPIGTPIVHRFRRQSGYKGTTINHYRLAENYYPSALVDEQIFEQLQKDVDFDVLKAIKQTHHKIIGWVDEQVSVRLPTPEEQDLLNIVRYTPVCEISRTNYAEDDDTVIMYNHIIIDGRQAKLSYRYKAPRL